MGDIKSEKHLSKRFRDLCKENNLKTWPFEDKAPDSVPDLHVCNLDTEVTAWIELKYVRMGEAFLKFQPGQPAWINEYHKCCKRAYILAAFWDGSVKLWDGSQALRLHIKGGFDGCRMESKDGLCPSFMKAVKNTLT